LMMDVSGASLGQYHRVRKLSHTSLSYPAWDGNVMTTETRPLGRRREAAGGSWQDRGSDVPQHSGRPGDYTNTRGASPLSPVLVRLRAAAASGSTTSVIRARRCSCQSASPRLGQTCSGTPPEPSRSDLLHVIPGSLWEMRRWRDGRRLSGD
jgi:hypothetical protein